MRGPAVACLPLMVVHIFIMSIIVAGELRTVAIVGPETLLGQKPCSATCFQFVLR